MRPALLCLALALPLVAPPAAAHSGLESGPIGPGGHWTWVAIDEGTYSYTVDGVAAGSITATGAGNYTGHRIALRDGRPDSPALSLGVGDFVTWTNRDNATHSIAGSFAHAGASSSAGVRESPAPAAVAVFALALLAGAGRRRGSGRPARLRPSSLPAPQDRPRSPTDFSDRH